MHATDRHTRFRTTRPLADLRQGRNNWFTIHAAQRGSVRVDINDEIGYFGVTANDFVNQLNEIKARTIDLHINSPGGEVFDGLTIYNNLVDHPATVNVTIDGLAASAASVIALAGDTRQIQANAMMMVHNGHGFAIGDAADMRDMADLLDKVNNNLAGVYAARAGGTTDEWLDIMAAETWYDANEAVEAGLATAVIGDKNTDDNTTATADFDLSVFHHNGRRNAPDPVFTTHTTTANTANATLETTVVPDTDTAPIADLAAFRNAVRRPPPDPTELVAAMRSRSNA